MKRFSSSSVLVLAFLLLAPSARAAEVAWLSLSGELVYRDASHACEVNTLFSGDLVLALATDGGRVTTARIRSGPPSLPTGELALSAEELATTAVRTDAKGHTWLTSLTLSGASLAWVYTKLGQLLCPLPQALGSVAGGPRSFLFAKESPEPGALTFPSSRIVFEGTRADGRSYRASLVLSQRPY